MRRPAPVTEWLNGRALLLGRNHHKNPVRKRPSTEDVEKSIIAIEQAIGSFEDKPLSDRTSVLKRSARK